MEAGGRDPKHVEEICDVFKAVQNLVCLELKHNQGGWSE